MCNTLGGILGGAVFGLLVKKAKDQAQSVALGLSGAGFLLAYFVRSLVPVLAGGVMVGAAFAFYNAIGTYLLAKYLKPENNAFTVSVYMAVINVGAALSPVVVNSVSGLAGDGTPVRYLVCGIAVLACGAVSLVVNGGHAKKTDE